MGVGRAQLMALGTLGPVLSLISACSNEGDGARRDAFGPGGAPQTEDTAVEIFSWWTDGGEQDALDAVLEVHEAEHAGVTVINAAVEYADAARATLETRMSEGAPPDTFQANIGADLLRWVGRTEGDTALVELDELADEEGWLDAFPPAILAAASKRGSLYGVPLNIHRINSLFYRKALFDDFDLSPPRNLSELNQLVETIKTDPAIQATSPTGVAPLALGNQWNWTMSLLTFEAILPAIGGARYYERFWAGEASPDDSEIVETLGEILFLYCGPHLEIRDPSTCDGYFNSDVDTITWSEGVQKLVDGEAAMAVMGDWAKGYLEGEGLVADDDFGVVPFPGKKGVEVPFVYTADTFPLPKGAPSPQAARALLVTFGSIEGQVAFNKVKGSIPARSDIVPAEHPEDFDSMHQATYEDFTTSRLTLALSGILARGQLENLAPELKVSMQAGTTEALVNYLRSNYDTLRP